MPLHPYFLCYRKSSRKLKKAKRSAIRTQTGNKRLFIIEAIKRGNKIINNILAKYKNPKFSKDLEINLMIIVLNFFNIFLLLSDCCLL